MEVLIIPILWVVVAINTMLGFVIFSRSWANPRNVVFGVIALSSAFWGFSIIAFHSPDFLHITNWVKFTHASALCVAFVFFVFSLIFPRSLRKSLIISLTASLFFLVEIYLVLFTDHVIGPRTGESNEYIIASGYVAYGFLLSFFFICGYVFLYFQYKKSFDVEERHQIKYILLGSTLASALALVPDLILPYFGIFHFTWLGPFFTLIMIFSIFIAMARYHLFNAKIIFTELFSGLIIFTLVVDLLLSRNSLDLTVKAVVLILISIISYLMIKGVYREVSQREKIERLAMDLKITNADLAKANEKLKELDKLKSEFLSLASHQIRGPLTAIRGYASEILEGDFGVVPKNLKDPVKVISSSSECLIRIVEDFLNISRIEQGRMKYNIEEFDLSALVKDVVEEWAPAFKEKRLSLNHHIAPKLRVLADSGKVRQVITNLLENGTKYTKEGGVLVNLMKTPEGTALLAVKDTGIGISEKTKGTLFQKFSRAEGASKMNTSGSGLGLYVAMQMLKAQNGKIWVESPGEGFGSTFFVELKLA